MNSDDAVAIRQGRSPRRRCGRGVATRWIVHAVNMFNMREECRVPLGSVHEEATREKVLRTTVVGGERMRKA